MLQRLFIFALILIASTPLAAATLDDLDKKLAAVDTQLGELQQLQKKEKQAYQQKLRNVQNQSQNEETLKQAYISAERLTRIDQQIQTLSRQRAAICAQWKEEYRKTMDDLIARADRQLDKKSKVDSAKKINHYQNRNAALCAESLVSAATNRNWTMLKIEPFDGPQEIKQKIQLLQDVDREINARIRKMDAHYQDFKREQKTKERIQEFMADADLFNSNPALAGGSRSTAAENPDQTTPVVAPGAEFTAKDVTEGNAPSSPYVPEWNAGKSEPASAENEYKKTRNDLLKEQQEIQKRIKDFEAKAKTYSLQ